MFRNTIFYVSGGLLLGSLTAYLYKYWSKLPINLQSEIEEEKTQSDLQRLIEGNNRFIKNKNHTTNSRILIVKQCSDLNPKVIFDSPYIDVIFSPDFCTDTLKIIENMFYKNQYNTIVIVNKDGNKDAKNYLHELIYESKFLNNLHKNKQLKPYWASYDSITSKVTFYHLFDDVLNTII